jgi:hypothetical protein
MCTENKTLQTNPWSHRLSRILRPTTSSSLCTRPTFIPRPPVYPGGEIWKHIFSFCVYSDLAGSVLWGKSNRRLVRFERFGLGGVILYEIPVVCGPTGCVRPMFAIEDGTSITRLLELTNTKVVYFPAYACTSFTVGLVFLLLYAGTVELLADGTGDACVCDRRSQC